MVGKAYWTLLLGYRTLQPRADYQYMKSSNSTNIVMPKHNQIVVIKTSSTRGIVVINDVHPFYAHNQWTTTDVAERKPIPALRRCSPPHPRHRAWGGASTLKVAISVSPCGTPPGRLTEPRLRGGSSTTLNICISPSFSPDLQSSADRLLRSTLSIRVSPSFSLDLRSTMRGRSITRPKLFQFHISKLAT
jgi:hypothetical protein